MYEYVQFITTESIAPEYSNKQLNMSVRTIRT